MTDVFDTPNPQPEPKRDRWGRYMLPDPAAPSGKAQPWTRATTFAKSIADTFGLTQWEMRMVAAGIGLRRDLYALACAATVDDKDTLNRVAKDAKEAAAASAGANLGTALHSFTEALDRGETVNAPEPWAADVDAYRTAMSNARITAQPDFVERIVVLKNLRVAGTLDRVVTLPDGRLAIGDLKTGKDLSYSWGEIAIQLALYANADVMWNGITDQYEPMPQVDKTTAVVMHLPVGKARCDLYEVDIAAGWEAAQMCAQVRQWRARRDLANTWGTTPAPTLSNSQLLHRQRIHNAIRAAGSEDVLTHIWRTESAAGRWLPEHTESAAERKQKLYATAA